MSIEAIIGTLFMSACGMGVAAMLFLAAAYVLNKMARRTWDRMRSVYRVETMAYWFKRMSVDGTHAVRKDYEEKLAAKAKESA